MKKQLHYITLAVLTAFSQTAFSQDVPEKIWVTFENINDVPTSTNAQLESSNAEVQQLINQFNIIAVEQALSNSKREDLLKVYEVECLCNAMQLSATIENTSTALSRPEYAPKYELLNDPNDYDITYSDDYALDLINAKVAWDYSTGDTNMILGVSDGGFYLGQEDLQSEYISVQSNGSVPAYYSQHGTAVSVTAAGATNNGMGKSSIGYDCKLSLASMGYNQVLQLSYSGSRVINVSWASGCGYNAYVQGVIDEVYDNGTIFVAAAGNGGTCGGASNLVYPAAHNHVIAVSSVGPYDNHEGVIGNPASCHQHNSSVDICAPGYNVPLTIGAGIWITGNGTSFAAPMVTGTIGLMLSVNPCLTFEEVEEILKQTAENIDQINPNYAGMLGAGRMDAGKALKRASANSCLDIDYPYELGFVVPGDTIIENPNEPGNENEASTEAPYDSSKEITGTDNGNDNGLVDNRIDTSEDLDLIVNISPNPTSSSTTVRWNLNQGMTMTVVDINGTIVRKEQLSTGTQEVTLELENAGIYMVEFEVEGRRKRVGKIVKL